MRGASGDIRLMNAHYAPDSVPPAVATASAFGVTTRSMSRANPPESMVSEEQSCGAAPLSQGVSQSAGQVQDAVHTPLRSPDGTAAETPELRSHRILKSLVMSTAQDQGGEGA